jgi:hypothetical protein
LSDLDRKSVAGAFSAERGLKSNENATDEMSGVTTELC